jgi:hypothetical protein
MCDDTVLRRLVVKRRVHPLNTRRRLFLRSRTLREQVVRFVGKIFPQVSRVSRSDSDVPQRRQSLAFTHIDVKIWPASEALEVGKGNGTPAAAAVAARGAVVGIITGECARLSGINAVAVSVLVGECGRGSEIADERSLSRG